MLAQQQNDKKAQPHTLLKLNSFGYLWSKALNDYKEMSRLWHCGCNKSDRKIRQDGNETKRRTLPTKLHSKIAFSEGEKKKPAYFFPQKMHFLNYETKEFLSFFLSDLVWLSQCNGGTYWSKIFMKITLCKGHFFLN